MGLADDSSNRPQQACGKIGLKGSPFFAKQPRFIPISHLISTLMLWVLLLLSIATLCTAQINLPSDLAVAVVLKPSWLEAKRTTDVCWINGMQIQ
jgi:hypothetical protein